MQTDELTVKNTNDEISPLRFVQHNIEELVNKNSVPLQYMLRSNNLLPEQFEMMYTIKLRELKVMANVRNCIELTTNDTLSQPHMVCYKVKDFLTAVVKQALNLIRMPSVDISFACDNCRTAVFDARKTSMIIYNLISNAIIHPKASEKRVRILAAMRSNDFVISVTDSGLGIPTSKRKNLFNAYADISAIDSLSANILTLNGMGLAISRKAAWEMKGDLVYVPTAKNTTFEIIIPQNIQSTLSEPVSYVADCEFAAMYLASANLIYFED